MSKIRKFNENKSQNILDLPPVFSKKELKDIMNVSYATMQRFFTKDVVENKIGVDFETWKKYRIFPPEISAKLKQLFISWGIHQEPILLGIYRHIKTNRLIQINSLDKENKKALISILNPITGKKENESKIELSYGYIISEYEIQN